MRAMPSPTSISVPTSLTCTFCSKLLISRFRTLVISATLMAIVSPNAFVCVRACVRLFRCRLEKLLLHRGELVADRRVDQLVADAEDHAADDAVVDVLVHDR